MTKAEIIASLLDQALDKDSLAGDEANDIFAEDAKALRAAVELLGKSEEVKPGRWVEHLSLHYYKCSECRCTVPYGKALLINGRRRYNYCPRCGAKMDGGEDNEE